jgi:hypothetical protein
MKRTLKWAWLAVVLSAIPARANTFKFEDAKLELEEPDGWKAEVDQEHHILHMTQPDQHVTIAAFSVDAADLDTALHDLGKELDRVMQDAAVVGEPTHTDIHDLHCAEVGGTGKVDDKEVDWWVCVVSGAEHPVVFVGFGIPEAFTAQHDEINQIFESIEVEK